MAVIKQKNSDVYKLETFKLDGGRVYCFTDGFSECLDDNKKEIGIEGVKELIKNHKNSSLKTELQNAYRILPTSIWTKQVRFHDFEL